MCSVHWRKRRTSLKGIKPTEQKITVIKNINELILEVSSSMSIVMFCVCVCMCGILVHSILGVGSTPVLCSGQ
jgi:hypothetical protein